MRGRVKCVGLMGVFFGIVATWPSMADERGFNETLKELEREDEKRPKATEGKDDKVRREILGPSGTKWRGPVIQDNQQQYDLLIQITSSGVNIRYPGLECGGKWNKISRRNKWVIYREKIQYGRSICVNEGYARVKRIAPNKIKFQYSETDEWSNPNVYGTLHRK